MARYLRSSRSRSRCLSKYASIASRSFGWLSLTAITKSPPPATMSRAISFWQPMASIVIRVPVRSICSRSWGMAVISLDFSSVATWPRAIPSSLAQALTMCSGPSPCAASCDRRQVLPSMATSRSGPPSSVRIASAIQSWKHCWKASGLSAMSRRRMQSREGMPLGSERNCASQSRRFSAQRWMAVGPSQPQTMPQTAMTTMSTSRCLRLRVCRGSESDSK